MIAAATATLIACLTVIGIRIGPALVHGLTGASYATPLDRTMSLTRGEWVVFERTGSQSGGGGVTFTEQGSVTLAPDDVEVTDPAGKPLRTSTPSTNETINRNGSIYTGAVAFDVPNPGRYRIQIAQADDQVLLSRDLGSLFGSVLGFILAAVAALIGIGTGAVTLIVSASRRRKRQAPLAVPGWYANPQSPGTLLWWNGYVWVMPSTEASNDSPS